VHIGGATEVMVLDGATGQPVAPLYLAHREDYDAEMLREVVEGRRPLQPSMVEFTRSVEESKALNGRGGPMIIISASGMATGGRVLHHLARRLPDPSTTVVFTGYQAGGTRGRKLLEGAQEIKIHGELRPALATPNRVRLNLRTMALREYGKPGGIPTLVDAPHAGHTAMVADYLLADWKSATGGMKDLEIDNYLAEIMVAIDDLDGRVRRRPCFRRTFIKRAQSGIHGSSVGIKGLIRPFLALAKAPGRPAVEKMTC